MILSGIFLSSHLQAQVFVDQNAGGANDGSSWTNAYRDLQTALTLTSSGQIWVADGIYKPITCNPCTDQQRQMAFQVPPDVQLYGGFDGTESSIDQRDLVANSTILSGDIGVANDSLDNSYNVLIAVNSTVSNVLDGFIIEEGNADGSFGVAAGGGLFLDANPGGTADMQIRHCTFRNNYAGGGGAIAIDCGLGGESRALIRDCIFEGNTASLGITSTGAAIFIQGNSAAQIATRIVSCIFRDNYCGNDGGAISATPTGQGSLLAMEIDSCQFVGNRADDRGGAIWYRMSNFGECRVRITNSQFTENEAGGEGGAIFTRSSFDNIAEDLIANCLFSRNRADGTSSINDGKGGAIFVRGSQAGNKEQLIVNCVFDRNSASHRGGAVATTSIETAPGICRTNLINCSFYGNTTEGEGGAIHTQDSTGTNTLLIANSILWADSAAVDGMEIFNDRSTVSLLNCDIAGGIPAGITDNGGLLDTDPMYSDPQNGDLHLPACSPLVDLGANSAIPTGMDTDLDGDPRIHAGTVDLGAYEIGIIYVDQSANGANNGRSWTNAFNRFEDGLAVAAAGDQIWVAEGNYRPITCSGCTDTDRQVAFRLVPDVEVYGGFAGDESALNQRDWVAHPTILSGDIGVPNDSLDNSFSVLIAENATEKTILDGFIIEEGNADGSFGSAAGGGLFLDANPGGTADLQIRNCTFRNNYAGGGGGIAIDCGLGGESRAEIRDCIFEGNTASLGITSTGAAVFIQGNSGAQILTRFVNCTFRNNFCGNDGGAISATPTGAESLLAMKIDSCLFTNNQSADRGGAIWYRMSNFGECRVVISNCRFLENTAGGEGGAIFARSSFDNVSADTIANCLFSRNVSDGTSTINDGKGGAIFLRGSQQGTRHQTVVNCVFDRNRAALLGGAIATTSIETAAGICEADIVNCTFSGNLSDGAGGALHAEASDGTNTVNIRNSILWNDQAAQNGAEIWSNNATVNVMHTDLLGGVPNGINDLFNNLNRDPQFKDPENGDLRPGPCSPVIDAGSNDLLPPDLIDLDKDFDLTEPIGLDLDGANRIFQSVVDLGAYEYDGTEPALTVNRTVTAESCGGACDGEVIMIPSGGQAGYTFRWSNGAASPKLENLCAGKYYVTINDASTCMLQDSIVIEAGEALGLEVSEDAEICPGGITELTASASGGVGFLDYNWDNDLGTGNQQQVSPQLTTTYSVTVSDFNGCFQSDSITVNVLAPQPPEIAGAASICPGSSTVLDAGDYATYSWSTGSDAREIDIDSPGVYGVTVTDTNSCISSAEIEVILADSLEVNIAGTLNFCPGGNTSLDAGAYTTYQWSTNAIEREISVNAPGTYSVSVTDEAGCPGTASVEVMELPEVLPDISGDTIFCVGESTVLDAGDYAGYVWSTQDTSRQIEVSAAGSYSVTVTNNAGCSGPATIVAIEQPIPEPVINGSQSICSGLSTSLEVSGDFAEYIWSTGDTTSSIEVAAAGIYGLTVTDETGCSGSTSIEVIENTSPVPTINGSESICPGTSATLEVGQFANYAWSTGENAQSIIVSEPGIYTVTVTDENGCTGNASLELMEADSLTTSIMGSETICAGAATVLEGVPGFAIYQWSTGETESSIEVNTAGTYSLTVTDVSGCSGSASVTVRESAALEPVINGNLSICNGTAGTLDAGNFANYQWSTGATGAQIEVSTPGLYSVTVSDDGGCTGTATAEVTTADSLIISIIGSSTFCEGGSTTLMPSTNAGVFEWSTGSMDSAIVVAESGTYTLTVTDPSGCSGSASISVSESAALSPVINGGLTFCAGDSSVLSVGDFAGYTWSTGATTQQITIREAGPYRVTVSDSQGCMGSTQVTAQLQSLPDVRIDGVTTFCPGDSTVLDGGSGYIGYQWSTGAVSQSIVVQSEGTYALTVSDAAGCTASDEILISFDLPEAAMAGADPAGCADTLNVMANLPPGTSGLWTSSDTGILILDPTSEMTPVTNFSDSPVMLTWTLSTEDCPDYSHDMISITPGKGPQAVNDQARILPTSRSVTINLLANDELFGAAMPTVSIGSEPSIGTLSELNNGVFHYSVPETAFGQVTFTYELCTDDCPCTTATVTVNIEPGNLETVDVANTITPNGDGFNESFVFDIIRNTPPEATPDNELTVFNRWGDIVFYMENYDNSWNGVNNQGQPLPEATYYYILRLNIGEGMIIRGDITIIR